MKRTIVLFILASSYIPVSAQSHRMWNDIRHSGRLADDSLFVRFDDSFSDAAVNSVLFPQARGFVSRRMQRIQDRRDTFQGKVPAPLLDTLFIGFRAEDTARVHIMPPLFRKSGMPVWGEFALYSMDAAGDAAISGDFLDIVEFHGNVSRDSLYFGIRNRGGGFPVEDGYTFYSYLTVMFDPDDPSPSPTVWALLYTVSRAGIIQPGLYRITGSSLSNMTRLAGITVQADEPYRFLTLGCAMKDLLRDPDFAAWYDTGDPALNTAAMTQKITLTQGVVEADRGEGVTLHPRWYAIAPFVNTLPHLENPRLRYWGDPQVEIIYRDEGAHFPVVADIFFNGDTDQVFPMFPETGDYSQPVAYRTEKGNPVLASGAWDSARVRFSDNGIDFVEASLTPQTSVKEYARVQHVPVLYQNRPNPFNDETRISFFLPVSEETRLSVWDASGRLVHILASGKFGPGVHEVAWDSSENAAGVYLIGMRAGHSVSLIKCLFLK